MKSLLLGTLALLLFSGRRGPSPTSAGNVRVISAVLPTTPKTEVKIYLPSHVRTVKELALFFHGDNLQPRSLDEIMDRHNMAVQIGKASQSQRRRNTAWVAPYSTGKNDRFKDLFSTDAKTQDFLGKVLQEISRHGARASFASNTIPLVVAGQSRAGASIRKLLALNTGAQVREVYLFDALYGGESAYEKFASAPTTRFWMACGASTMAHCKQLYQMLDGKTSKGIFSNLSLPKVTPNPDLFLKGGSLQASFGFTDKEKQNPIGFVNSPVEHKYTARNYLAALMS